MQTTLILSVVVPAVLAGVVLAVGHWVWRAGTGGPGRWSMAFAPPVGAFAAYTVVRGFPSLPPSDASVWPLWATAFTALAVLVGARGATPVALRFGGAVVAAVAVMALVVRPLLGTWSSVSALVGITVPAAALLVAWLALESRSESVPGPAVPLALAGLSGATAAVLGASGTALLSQATAGLAVANGLILLLAAWRPTLRVSGSAVGPTLILLGGFLVAGVHYADVQLWSPLVLAAGAIVVGLAPLPKSGRSPWRAAVSLGFVVILAGAAAAGPALMDTVAEPAAEDVGDDGYDDGYDY